MSEVLAQLEKKGDNKDYATKTATYNSNILQTGVPYSVVKGELYAVVGYGAPSDYFTLVNGDEVITNPITTGGVGACAIAFIARDNTVTCSSNFGYVRISN